MRTIDRMTALLTACVLTAGTAQAQSRRSDAPERPTTPPLELPRRPLAASVALGGVRAEIGREEEAGPYMFGSVGSATLGPDGTVYVSEQATGEIRMFDLRGEHLGTFGRRGRGPGEFVNSIGLVHDGDSTLFAVQQGYGVTELTARGARVRYRRTFGTEERYSSLCTLGGRTFVSMGGDSALIRELDADRRELRGFGEPFAARIYGTPNAAAVKLSRQSGPMLICDAPRATLYAMRGDQGIIRAYHPDGRMKWETTLPSFMVGLFGAQPGGGAYVAWSIDYIATLMPLGGTRLLVQAARQDPESARGRSRAPGASIQWDVTTVTAYILDATTGRILSRSPGAGLISPLADTVVAERVSDPWPMLRLRPVRSITP